MHRHLAMTLILVAASLGCGPDLHLKMSKAFLEACDHYRNADEVVDVRRALRYVKNEDAAADVELVRHIMTGTCPVVASKILAMEREAAEREQREKLLEEADEDSDT